MSEPIEILSLLQKTDSFQNWQEEHSKSFLCYFFRQLGNDFQAKTYWELGYFNLQDEKITVFAHQGDSNFIIRLEEEIFKMERTRVDALDIKKVKFPYSQAVVLLKEKVPSLFPKQKIRNGFVILQTIAGKTLWNVTFMSESLQFLNLRIEAENGGINSYQAVDVIRKNEPLTPT